MESRGKNWENTTFAQRLEHVRVGVAGIDTLSGFQRALTEDGDFSVHYNSVINYHTHTQVKKERRQPSLEYVLRVCEVFGVRPQWLLQGRGQPTEAGHIAEEALQRSLAAEEPEPGEPSAGPLPGRLELPVDTFALNALILAWKEVAEPLGSRLGDLANGGDGATKAGRIWRTVQDAVASPVHALSEAELTEIRGDRAGQEAFNDYVADVAVALRRYCRAMRRGASSDTDQEDS